MEEVPSESHFEPCSQRYGLFLVCGCRHLELLGAFLGRFRDISWSWRAAKGSLTRGSQATRECTHRFPSFGRFECVPGLFFAPK